MALSRLPLQCSRAIRPQGVRTFATSLRHQERNNILDVLPKTSQYEQTSPSTASPTSSPRSATGFAKQLLSTDQVHKEIVAGQQRQDYERQIFRKWQPGDVYAPHDLSGPEQRKWKKSRQTPKSDAFDTLGINPVNEYKNFTMMSEYMTEMGRIKHSSQTGLRPVNQRKIAKAIRRAIGLGLMPSVHRHPLVTKSRGPGKFQ